MVFGKDYDRSLWLAISSDKKNRFDITELIYKMPKELLGKIRNQLEGYSNNLENYDCESKVFRQAVMNGGDDNYFYCVEMNLEEINIKLSKWRTSQGNLEEKFKLSLVPLSNDDLLNINPEAPTYIGSYYYSGSQIIPYMGVIALGRESEYLITNDTSLGIIMRNSEDSKFFRIINLSKMPVDIEVDDLKDRCSVNKLVRGRKKK